VPFLSQRQHAGLVAAQGEPIEEQAVDLAFQFTG
jgi:hypothetical protein